MTTLPILSQKTDTLFYRTYPCPTHVRNKHNQNMRQIYVEYKEKSLEKKVQKGV